MKIKRWIAVLLTAFLLCGLLPAVQVAAADMPQEIQKKFARGSYSDPDSGLTLPYRIYVPKKANGDRKYSFLLFLHGAGERGTDNERQIAANSNLLTRIVNSTDPDQSCIIVAPQCPNDKQWVDTPWENGSYSVDTVPQSRQMEAVMRLVEQLTGEYAVDMDRMYIAGVSMGGYGTWDTIIRYPDMFAAAIPVCGAGDPTKASLIKDVPIRTYHSTDDGTVPVSGTQQMVAALQAAGGHVIYTEYNDAGHFAWEPAFNDEALLDWLFAQHKPAVMQSVIQPKAISVLQGTPFVELPLPETVKVKLTNGETVAASVTWSQVSDTGAAYDADSPGVYTLLGTLQSEDRLNPDGLAASITVTVMEASQPVIVPGDLDKDGEVTIADVMEVCKVLARKSADIDPTAAEISRGDLDGDEDVTIADVMEICKTLARKNAA